MRAPFQILTFPFIKEGEEYFYALFKRNDLEIWQAIAGGGEDDETPLEAMRREAYEEAMIDRNSPYIRLSAIAAIPAVNICGLKWGDNIMIPEISFGVELTSKEMQLSHEHSEYRWLSCKEAMALLKYDSNKSALWELDYRLRNGLDGIEGNMKLIEKYYSSI